MIPVEYGQITFKFFLSIGLFCVVSSVSVLTAEFVTDWLKS